MGFVSLNLRALQISLHSSLFLRILKLPVKIWPRFFSMEVDFVQLCGSIFDLLYINKIRISLIKGELHSDYIFLYFVLIGLEWDSINLFTKMNFFFFQNSHFSTIYTRHIYDLLFTNMNIF